MELFDNKPLSEEEMGVVKLARKKVDNRLVSGMLLEKSFLERLKASIDIDQSQAVKSRVQRRASAQKSRAASPDKLTSEDLQGWSTQDKSSNEHDFIQLASSVVLHPAGHLRKENSVSSNELMPTGTGGQSTELKSVPSKASIIVTPTASNLDATDGSVSAEKPEEPNDPPAEKATGISNKQEPLTVAVSSDTSGEKSSNHQQPASLSASGYKKATKAVKHRLIKTSSCTKVDKDNVNNEEEKPLANGLLSDCTVYSIEKKKPSGAITSSSINLTERLAENLKHLSQGVKAQKGENIRSLSRSVSRCTNETMRLKNFQKVSPKSDDRELPSVLSGSPLTIPSLEGSRCKLRHSQDEYHLPDIESPKGGNTLPSNKFIPRQAAVNQYRLNNVGTEAAGLPRLSVTPLPCKPSATDVTEALESTYQDNNGFRRGGIPVRAGVCTSPYIFDREDADSLALRAKPLPYMHTVCTLCGRISKTEDRPCACASKTLDKYRRLRYDGRMNKEGYSISKQSHHDCSKEKCFSDPETLNPERSRNSSCGKQNIYNGNDNMSARKLAFEVPVNEECKQKASEEMDIRYMNQDIKLKFLCEISLENRHPKLDTSTDRAKPLHNFAMPRQHSECPDARETRIYAWKNGNRFKKTSSFEEVNSPTNLATKHTEPYLEYYKRKDLEKDLLQPHHLQMLNTSKYILLTKYRTKDFIPLSDLFLFFLFKVLTRVVVTKKVNQFCA